MPSVEVQVTASEFYPFRVAYVRTAFGEEQGLTIDFSSIEGGIKALRVLADKLETKVKEGKW